MFIFSWRGEGYTIVITWKENKLNESNPWLLCKFFNTVKIFSLNTISCNTEWNGQKTIRYRHLYCITKQSICNAALYSPSY
jgi:hypothetical protein